MRTEYFYDSLGGGTVRACRWTPAGEIRAIVQIVHGIAEHVERYDDPANFLNTQGILVVAEDHMGHGKSINEASPRGCFAGGWMNVAGDTYRLMQDTMAEFPEVPFILFGHSMGSFLARTILARYPESGIRAAIICGTGWLPTAVVQAGKLMCSAMGRIIGEQTASAKLHGLIFGGYNKRIESPRTPSDWLSRDAVVVDAYEADPMCGFVPSCGLLRDMMSGILYIQDTKNLDAMKKDLPCLFIAGSEDPVGNYGAGVVQAAEEFKKHGMQQVECKLYPDCRHEIHNELNKQEVYADIAQWVLAQSGVKV